MSKKLAYLSHFLDEHTPLYGGAKGVSIIPDRDISNGDTANTKLVTLHNHSGTHIDFPNHFFVDGKKSNHYQANFWVFENPYIIDKLCNTDEIIDFTVKELFQIPPNTDFLIVNTGFHKYRNEERFWKNNPGFSPFLAAKLKDRCKSLRVLGMDSISLTAFQNRELGRAAHRAFLGEHNILIVEDMNLTQLDFSPTKLMCAPLLLNNVDGAPVTIIAEN